MTSISSRIVPASTTLSLIRSFVRDFHEQRHPIHEVDANVLAGELFSLPAATRHPDFDVSGAGQAAAAVKMEGRSWILVCHDSMSGQRPVATAHINVGMNLNSNGLANFFKHLPFFTYNYPFMGFFFTIYRCKYID